MENTSTTYPFTATLRTRPSGNSISGTVYAELRAKTLRGLERQLGQRLNQGTAVIWHCPSDYRTGYRIGNAESTGFGWRWIDVTSLGYFTFGVRRYDDARVAS